jgi:Secretion system C-terminal sorting domain/SprB repeat
MGRIYLSILFISFTQFIHAQKTWFVSPSATGNQTGTSWQNAFSDLHSAFQASNHGDAIFVQAGIFTPAQSDRTVFFELKSGVRLYGGFAGTESTPADRIGGSTILSGNIGNQIDSTDNSHTILAMILPDSTTLIDGCTFEGGYAKSDSAYAVTSHFVSGGAIYVMAAFGHARPRFQNCIFQNNYAKSRGGAIYIYDESVISSLPSFENCTFRNNRAGISGGALYLTVKCHGGESLRFTKCNFIQNKAQNYGGCMTATLLDTVSIVSLRDTFVSNEATFNQGGIYHLQTDVVKGLDVKIDSMLSEGSSAGIVSGFSILGQGTEIYPASFSISNSTITKSKKTNTVGNGTLQFFRFLFPDRGDQFSFTNSTVVFDTIVFARAMDFFLFKALSLKNNKFLNRLFLPGNTTIQHTIDANYFASPVAFFVVGSATNNIIGSSAQTILQRKFGINKDSTTVVANNLFLNIKESSNFFPAANIKAKVYNNIFVNCRDSLNRLTLPLNISTNTPFTHNAFDIPCSQIVSAQGCGNGNMFLAGISNQLENVSQGNFRLKPCSALINKGLTTPQLPVVDIENQSRITDGKVDMGPHESLSIAINAIFSSTSTCTSTGSIAASIPLACGNLKYQWVRQDSTSGTRIDSLMSGIYTMAITDTLNRTIITQITVGVLDTILTQQNVEPINCGSTQGGKTTITVLGGIDPYTLNWSDGITQLGQFIRSQMLEGSYTVTITDQQGCSNVAPISISKNGQLLVLLDGTEVKCYGDSTGSASVKPLNGLAPYHWLWNTSDTAEVLQQLPAGNYTTTVTDALGCQKITTFTLNQPQALLAQGNTKPNTSLGQPNGSIQIFSVSGGVGTYHFAWSTGDTSAQLQGLISGQYSVTISDANGCTLSTTYFVDAMIGTALVDNEIAKLQVTPNPADSDCIVSILNSNGDLYHELSILDLTGRVIVRRKMNAALQVKIETKDFQSGVYQVILQNPTGGVMSNRLFVVH